MSEAPRDEATGQFTPAPIPTEGLFGLELEQAEAGFRTKPRDETPSCSPRSSAITF